MKHIVLAAGLALVAGPGSAQGERNWSPECYRLAERAYALAAPAHLDWCTMLKQFAGEACACTPKPVPPYRQTSPDERREIDRLIQGR